MRQPRFLPPVLLLTLLTLTHARDYYSLLDVPRDAPVSVIKKSYRRLARLYHPDKHPGDAKMEQKFKDISQAYEVLSDDRKRQTYDAYGEEGLQNGGGGGGGSGGAGGFHHGFGGGGFRMDIDPGMFHDMFGGGFGSGGGFGGFGDSAGFGRRRRPRPPRRQKVCFQNKICENDSCFMVKECKT